MAKRVDGLTKLTAKEKAERDARAQYWMNQRKIERVAEAAYKSGWHVFPADLVDELVEEGFSTVDNDGNLILNSTWGQYRVEEYRAHQDDYVVRKIG